MYSIIQSSNGEIWVGTDDGLNSISHGIENPAERELKVKQPSGEIEISASSEADMVSGRGVGMEIIRQKNIDIFTFHLYNCINN